MKWKRVAFSINFGLKNSLGGKRNGADHYLVGFACDRSTGPLGKRHGLILQRPRAEDVLRRKARRLDVRLAGSSDSSGGWIVHGWAATGESGKISQGGIRRGASRRLGPDRAPGGHGDRRGVGG